MPLNARNPRAALDALKRATEKDPPPLPKVRWCRLTQ